MLRQTIMHRIYTILSKYGVKKLGPSTFNIDVLQSLQTDDINSFHHVFETILGITTDETIESSCFRVVIVNILKHAFIEEWLPEVVHLYTSNKYGSTDSLKQQNDKSLTLPLEILNDDDVNRWFGWAVMKLKKIQ